MIKKLIVENSMWRSYPIFFDSPGREIAS